MSIGNLGGEDGLDTCIEKRVMRACHNDIIMSYRFTRTDPAQIRHGRSRAPPNTVERKFFQPTLKLCNEALIFVRQNTRLLYPSASTRWTRCTEIDPSPTAEATRFTFP